MQGSDVGHLTWKCKLAFGDEYAIFNSFGPFAILTAFVRLVFSYQMVKIWICPFISNTARDSLLDPAKDIFRLVLVNGGRTIGN